MIISCAWCIQVKRPARWRLSPSDTWRDGPPPNAAPGTISHGICEDCERREFGRTNEEEE